MDTEEETNRPVVQQTMNFLLYVSGLPNFLQMIASSVELKKTESTFAHLFGDEESSDMTVKVRTKEFNVHKRVMVSHFKELAEHQNLQDTSERRQIIIKDCDPVAFEKYIEYLYCFTIQDLSFRDTFNLYHISNKYDFEELRKFCIKHLIKFLTVQSFVEIALFANNFAIAHLMFCIQVFFNQNVNKILVTIQWRNLIYTDYNIANNLLLMLPKVEFH